MVQFINALLIGLTAGAIYSLMSLSIVLVWRSTRVVNFAQAGLGLLSTYLFVEILKVFTNFWIALILSMVLGALLSACIEIFFMRLLLKHSSQGPIAGIAPIIATLGLLGAIHALIGMWWGNGDVQVEAPFSKVGFTFGSETISFSPMNLFVISAVGVIVITVTWIFQRTNLGLSLRASAYAPEISRLAGIRVDLIRTIGWSLAGAASATAGILQSMNGNGSISPDPLEFSLLLVFGFVAAVIGGLESLPGAVVGALVLGLVLTFVQIYISGTVVFISALALLLLLLLIRPQGLFGSKVARRA